MLQYLRHLSRKTTEKYILLKHRSHLARGGYIKLVVPPTIDRVTGADMGPLWNAICAIPRYTLADSNMPSVLHSTPSQQSCNKHVGRRHLVYQPGIHLSRIPSTTNACEDRSQRDAYSRGLGGRLIEPAGSELGLWIEDFHYAITRRCPKNSCNLSFP